MKNLITSWNDVPVVLDLPFAAELLGLSVYQLKKESRSGNFPAFKIGEKSWRVSKDDLIGWMDSKKIHTQLKDKMPCA